MKLLNSFGPNPRVVRMFILEKNIAIPFEEHNIASAENRGAAYVKKNPAGQMPSLELDDGTVFGETTAICEYLEEKHPRPALFGESAEERANTRQWVRRVEFNNTEHSYNGFRSGDGIEVFRERLFVIPEAADGLKAKASEAKKWLDGLIAGRDFIAGDKFTFADIALYSCLDFIKDVGQPLDDNLKNLAAWFARIDARPSTTASLHPTAAERKRRA